MERSREPSTDVDMWHVDMSELTLQVNGKKLNMNNWICIWEEGKGKANPSL
jgi:hypothetical protein